MTWLGLLLVGAALSDLGFSWSRRPRVAEGGAALAVVVLALLCGVEGFGHVLGVVLVVACVVAWGESVTYGFGTRRFALPLCVLAGEVAAMILLSGSSAPAGGPLGRWLDDSSLPLISGLDPGRAVLLAGVLLVQLSTGNVLVRLVLGASGTTHPMRSTTGPAPALKGGRLLGPMERVFIVGLGLAGQVTAASIVIAAKGLLRFPELQSARTDAQAAGGQAPGPGIHEVTEYFLVGSFVSWTISLVALALAST